MPCIRTHTIALLVLTPGGDNLHILFRSKCDSCRILPSEIGVPVKHAYNEPVKWNHAFKKAIFIPCGNLSKIIKRINEYNKVSLFSSKISCSKLFLN